MIQGFQAWENDVRNRAGDREPQQGEAAEGLIEL